MRVSFFVSNATRTMYSVCLSVPEKSTLEQAIALCKKEHAAPAPLIQALDSSMENCGIFGKISTLQTILQDQDRIEIYRPLRVDPKTARRERFQKQGARSAGLFAKRRPGAKPGY